MLELRSISKSYDGVTEIITDLSIVFKENQIFCLLGGSGSGKSTLLRMIAGFEKPTKGQILLDGEDITHLPPYKRPLNMMFQNYALFPHLTVEGNILFGLKFEKLSAQERLHRLEEALSLVELEPFAKRLPHELSGGQRQRVALARVIAKRNRVILFDEPLGALDKSLRERTQIQMQHLQKQLGMTFIIVTHDDEEAMTLGDQIAVLDKGNLVHVGTPEDIYESPTTRYVASIIGSTNLLNASLVRDNSAYGLFQIPYWRYPLKSDYAANGTEGMDFTLSLRPEKIHIQLEEPEQSFNKVQATVADMAYYGSHTAYYLDIHQSQKVLLPAKEGTLSEEDYCPILTPEGIEIEPKKRLRVTENHDIHDGRDWEIGEEVWLLWEEDCLIILDD